MDFLNNLNRWELKRFEEFLMSPYFNTYKTMIVLFQYLKTLHPFIKHSDITPSKISMIVYSEENVNSLKIRKLWSDFKKLLETFLYHEFIATGPLMFNAEYSQYLDEREMTDLSESNLKEAELILDNSEARDEGYYLKKYQLSLISTAPDIYSSIDYDYKIFNEELKNIDYLNVSMKLRSLVNVLIIKHENNKVHIQGNVFEKEVIKFVESRKNDLVKNQPYIYFLYLAYKMFSTLNDKYYNLLVKYFNTHKDKLMGKTLCSFHVYQYYYLNFKLKSYSKNSAIYHKKLYNFYIQIFNSDYSYKSFIFRGLIQNSFYISVLTTFLNEGDNDNAFMFLIKYVNYQHENIRKDTFNYSMGLYHYNINDLTTALTYFNEISDKSATFKYYRKAALMRLYFELGDMVSLNNEMTNMYQFGYRNKEGGKFYKQNIMIYLKYFRLLIRLKSIKSSGKKNLKFEKNILKKQIENEGNLLQQKSWFIKMVNSI